MDIYARIHAIDIAEGSGLRAVVPGEALNEDEGYVLVAESEDGVMDDVLRTVHIPDKKKKTYELAQALFDNYDIYSLFPDEITAQERAEEDALIDGVKDSAPMRLAREYIDENSGSRTAMTDGKWEALIRETWFRSFSTRSSPTRSGFEHVFLGEHSTNRKVGGLHWWYYYLKHMDSIDYQGAEYRGMDDEAGIAYPHVATMKFKWSVNNTTLYKSIGGFFVGISVEGLMAMGMVRANPSVSAPDATEIEGGLIDLALFADPNNPTTINTFYPILTGVLIGPVPPPEPPEGEAEDETPAPPPISAGGVRIVSMVSNPEGAADQGNEKLTLLNITRESVSLEGWQVAAPNGMRWRIGKVVLDFGDARTLTLPKSVPLSNKGGTVTLYNAANEKVQEFVYTQSDAAVQGGVLLWDGATSMTLLS